MKKVLYVNPNENIAYLVNRIEETAESEVYLAPDAAPALFEDAVNAKFLKREVDFLEKRLVVVSQHDDILTAAQTAGFETLRGDAFALEHEGAPLEHSPAPKPQEEAPFGGARPSDPVEFQENNLSWKDEESEEVKVNVFTRTRGGEGGVERGAHQTDLLSESEDADVSPRRLRGMFSAKSVVVVVLALALLSGGAYYFLSSKMSLTIVPKKEMLNIDFQITADTKLSGVDLENAKIPGTIVKVEKEISDSFPATGKQNQDTKAQGATTIYNAFGSASQVLVKNTRFKSKDGKIFRLKATVTVPGARMEGSKVAAPGTIDAEVEADQTGPSYNVEPGEFSVPGFEGTPKFLGFYGKSTKIMTGGALGNVPFATKEDMEKAEAALQTKAGELTEAYVAENIPKGSKVLEGALSKKTTSFSTGSSNAEGMFQGTLKVAQQVFVFAESDVAALVEHILSGKLAQKQTTVPGTRTISYVQETLGANNTTLGFTVKVSELTVGSIDTDVLKNDIAGKTEGEIKDVLRAQSGIENAEFTFSPLWSSQAPKNPEKIAITIAQ